jgi:hypothetical protein
LGIIGSKLGQLFLLAGMGEPGRFAQDDLRFLLSNITIAVKSLGYDQFASASLALEGKNSQSEMPFADFWREFGTATNVSAQLRMS